MLDFSSSQQTTNTISNCLFPSKPTEPGYWPITDSNTKKNISTLQYFHSVKSLDWQWPLKKIYFISDIHADTNALVASLMMAKIIKKSRIKPEQFTLTSNGKKGVIIIGGDCLDKGPANLSLLRTLHKLLQVKKDIVLLAGNHDIRLLMGLKSMHQATQHDIASEHFFIRMSPKIIPLLKEIYDEYISNSQDKYNSPNEQQCRSLLYPSKQWQSAFIAANKALLHPEILKKELKKIQKKSANFESRCLDFGLSLSMVYLAAKKCYSLFLEPDGEFYWFFQKMKLVHREKSFLFTHAGLDNEIAKIIETDGINAINTRYKQMLNQNLCQFYYGIFANMIRTKYRKNDPGLSSKAVKRLHNQGIHAIMHGHLHKINGQNITLRAGMLHFECDITLDINSRKKSGLRGYGAGITMISPKGNVKGISTDSSTVKLFKPS